jgi:hypothetical protein
MGLFSVMKKRRARMYHVPFSSRSLTLSNNFATFNSENMKMKKGAICQL